MIVIFLSLFYYICWIQMNSYAKVRAPGSKQSVQKDKKPSQISINLKQPFILIKSPIEQPRAKVSHTTPSVVHIIQRKAGRKQVQKEIHGQPQSYFHVIQPSFGKKGWRFRNIDSEHGSSKEQLSQKQSQKAGVEVEPALNLEEKGQQMKKSQINQVIPLVLEGFNLEQSMRSNERKVSYQRQLEKINFNPSQFIEGSEKSNLSKRYQQSSAHLMDQQQNGVNLSPIEIQAIVQSYKMNWQNDVQPHHRNLFLKKLVQDPLNAVSAPFHGDNIEIQEADEQFAADKPPLFLRRFLQPSQLSSEISEKGQKTGHRMMSHNQAIQGQHFFEIRPENEVIEQSKKEQKMMRKLILVDKEDLQDIAISEEYQKIGQAQKSSKLTRKIMLKSSIADRGNIESILIPVEIEKIGEYLTSPKMKRLLNVQDQSNEGRRQEMASRKVGLGVAPRQGEQQTLVFLQQDEELIGASKKAQKMMRNLLILQGMDGKLATQQIIIPTQVQNINRNHISSPHQRYFKIIEIQQKPQQKLKSNQIPAESLQPFQKNDFNIELNPIVSSFSPKPFRKPMKRNLLLAIQPHPNQKQIYQSIIIPQDFQIRNANVAQIRYSRQAFQPSFENEKFYEKQVSKVGKGRALGNDQIQINPMSESIVVEGMEKSRKSLRRGLAKQEYVYNLTKQKKIEVAVDEQKSGVSSRLTVPHKRLMNHLQAEEGSHFQNMAIPDKIQCRQVVIEDSPLQEKYNVSSPTKTLKRQLNLIQFEDNQKEFRDKAMGRGAGENKIEIVSQEESVAAGRENSKKMRRSLLVAKDNMGEITCQQIFIDGLQQQQAIVNESNLKVVNHHRKLKVVDPQSYQEKTLKFIEEKEIPMNDQDYYCQEKLRSGQPTITKSAPSQIQLEKLPQKSLNQSTLNASIPNPTLQPLLQQSTLQTKPAKLTRNLAPINERLFQSQRMQKKGKFFNVYNPSGYLAASLHNLSGSKLGISAISMGQRVKLSRAGSKWRARPHRRPGMKP